jgi:hypothetical protein
MLGVVSFGVFLLTSKEKSLAHQGETIGRALAQTIK